MLTGGQMLEIIVEGEVGVVGCVGGCFPVY